MKTLAHISIISSTLKRCLICYLFFFCLTMSNKIKLFVVCVLLLMLPIYSLGQTLAIKACTISAYNVALIKSNLSTLWSASTALSKSSFELGYWYGSKKQWISHNVKPEVWNNPVTDYKLSVQYVKKVYNNLESDLDEFFNKCLEQNKPLLQVDNNQYQGFCSNAEFIYLENVGAKKYLETAYLKEKRCNNSEAVKQAKLDICIDIRMVDKATIQDCETYINKYEKEIKQNE